MSRLARLLRPPRRGAAFALVAVTLLFPTLAARAADGTWQELPPITGRPFTAIVIDPVRDRLIVLGGQVAPSTGSMDVWSWNFTGSPGWTKLLSTGAGPRPRVGHVAVYDPVGDRIILFGGNGDDDTRLNDVWALSLAGTPAWIELTPNGSPPPPRYYASAAYDPVRGRMLVFGGSSATYLNDLWSLSLSGTPEWTQLPTGGVAPSPCFGPSLIYDSTGDRLVAFGGYRTSGGVTNQAWSYSLQGPGPWSLISPSSGSPPAARTLHCAVYDAAGNRMILFGGYPNTGGPPLNDVWALSLGTTPGWSSIAPLGSAPTVRYGHSAVYDGSRGRMLVFGGWWPGPLGNLFFNDLEALTLQGSPTWSTLWPENTTLPGRRSASGICDPVRRRMLVFGGENAGLADVNEMHALPLDSPTGWSRLFPTGAAPSARDLHTAIYDPVRDRMLVFGGGDPAHPPDPRNDLWSLTLAGATAWSQVTPVGPPPDARRGHSAVYDPVRDRMLVFGGTNGNDLLNDVWELTLSGTPAWHLLAPTGSPPSARQYHTAIYDPVGDRMIVFAGLSAGAGGRTNDIWALTLAGTPSWSPITPAGGLPDAREGHTAVYDPARSRMVVYGGFGTPDGLPARLSDAWALDLSATPAWSALSFDVLPPARDSHIAIADPVEDRMIISAGALFLADTWFAQWPASTGVPTPSVPVALRLGASAPNPASGALAIPFGLPTAATARLTVLDLQGRVIRTLVRASLPAGSHVAHWDGRTATGARARSGVYLYRLDALGDHRSGRLVITE